MHQVTLFLKKLQYAVIGYGIAGFCVFAFEMLAGRILGPAEYGKYALVSTVGLFMYVLMTLGMNTSAITYGSVENKETQKKVISTSYGITIVSSLCFGLLFFIFSEKIASFISLPLSLFRPSILFGICFALYAVSTDSLRTIYNIKSLSFFRAGYGVFIVATFLYLFFINSISFTALIFTICVSHAVIFFLISFTIRKHLSFTGETLLAKKMLTYGLYAAVGGSLLVFLPSLSQIFVNKYLSPVSVGIYNAYYFSSVTFATFFFDVFLVVFFPAVLRHEQKEVLLKKIRDVTPVIFLAGVPVLFIIQFVILQIYGDKYPLDFGLMILFSFSTLMICIYGLYSWFFYSTGILGAKRITILTVFLLVTDIILHFYLVPLMLLWGAIVATGFSYAMGLVFMYVFFVKNNNMIAVKNVKKTVTICHVASSDLTIKFILSNFLMFLKNQQYNVSAVCSPGKWVLDIKNKGFSIKEITISRKVFTPISDLIALIALIFYFKKEQINIVHTHTPKAGLLGRLAAKIAGVPIIIHTNHGFHFQNNTPWLARKAFIFLETIGAKWSDLIFSVNKEDIETAVAENICPREKIIYSGDGIDVEVFNPAHVTPEWVTSERKKLGIDADSIVIGFVGRLVKEKGILDLIEAFLMVKKEFPKAVLLVVGPREPEKKDSIDQETFKEPGIKEHIVFLGERTDMEKIYPLMDIFVLPSHREGLGLVLLEAQAMGKPVIATNIRGCREAVQDGVTGTLVLVADVNVLAKAIMYLMQNPAKALIMGENGRKRTQSNFDQRNIFDKINQEYQRLIAKKL